MTVCGQAPILDAILDGWRKPLGGDYAAYRNHCYRVLNFCLALSRETPEIKTKVSIAAAFHDLGIWTDNTYDYLEPSLQHARGHLKTINREAWSEEIEAMIAYHHKISTFRTRHSWLVEPFRRADWIDVSRGMLKFGLSGSFVAGILSTFPNEGFHKRLAALTWQRLKTHPFSPLPMMKL